jgi:hypothetical protein
MGQKKLAVRFRNSGDYFSRRRSLIMARRSISAAILYLGFHMWGIGDMDKVAYGAAWWVITTCLESDNTEFRH